MADRRNIEPACRHVGGHEETQRAVAERVQRAHPLRLVQIAMDRGGVEAMRLQRLGDDIDLGLAVAEDDRVLQVLALGLDQGAQQFALLLGGLVLPRRRDLDQLLGDGFRGGGLTRDLDTFGRVQEGIGDALDLGGHGSREEQRLPGEGGQLEDTLDIRDETHVEHPVGLIDHHHLDPGQQQLAALEMVQQPARRGDQHIDAAVDQLVLLAEGNPADQQRLGQAGMLGIDVEVFRHLRRQFPRRAKDQRARHPRPGPATRQPRDHRQGEAGGLAGPGLGDAQHVAAFQRRRDRARLDRGRAVIASFGHGLENFRIELQVRKSGHMRPFAAPRAQMKKWDAIARPSFVRRMRTRIALA